MTSWMSPGLPGDPFLQKKEYVDIQVLIDDAVVAAEPASNSKQHTLRVERPSTPIQLEVDPVRMTQVLTNLLTNATKYAPKGGLIYIGARLETQHLVVYVRDNGVGLEAEALSKVFEMFTRVEPEVGRSEGGLGIGLALAKGIVELHGGRIEAHSAGPNQGSEFVIFLPRSLVVAVTAPVAEQDRDTANPTLVAERIRHEAWGKDITLIAITGCGQDADKRRALAAGFDHHLTKPIDPEVLGLLFDASAGS
jgi:anti-sigma regulatory factor (Ser/Thr protein kinase)